MSDRSLSRALRCLLTVWVSGCEISRHERSVIGIVGALSFVHLAMFGGAWSAVGRSETPWQGRVTVLCATFIPMMCNGYMAFFPPSSGADGLSRMWPGLGALATVPISWLVLVAIALWTRPATAST